MTGAEREQRIQAGAKAIGENRGWISWSDTEAMEIGLAAADEAVPVVSRREYDEEVNDRVRIAINTTIEAWDALEARAERAVERAERAEAERDHAYDLVAECRTRLAIRPGSAEERAVNAEAKLAAYERALGGPSDEDVERAARRVVIQWERWQAYLHDLGLGLPYNGIAPFTGAMFDLERALEAVWPGREEA